MKIGFSLGRCIRDIVNNEVNIDDVAFIITATNIHTEEQLSDVISNYEYQQGYLEGVDIDQAQQVGLLLWNSSRLLQPRRQGLHRHMQPADSVWVDMYPTISSSNPAVKNAWEAYRVMLQMTENVSNESMDTFKKK